MRNTRMTLSSRLLAALAGLTLGSCDDHRVVSGPSGTETGNAIQARILREDGSAAAGARVAIRRSSTLDQTGTILLVADESGRISTRLEDGDWTLEAREDGSGLRIDMRLQSDTALDSARLLRLGTVVGKLQSGVAMPSLAVSGLGRRIQVGADGTFKIDSIPFGNQPLVLVGSAASWSLKITPGSTDSVLLDDSRPGELFQASALRVIIEGGPLPRRSVLPQLEKGWLLSETEWTDSAGNVIPVLAMSDSAGPVGAWTLAKTRTTLQPRRVLSGRVVSPPVFRTLDGFRLAIAFPRLRPILVETDTVANLAAPTVSVPLDSEGEFLFDPIEGKVRRSPIGASFARLDTALIPSIEGTISIRSALEHPDISRIWLVDWTDTSIAGLRIGIGAGALYVHMPDTTEIVIPAENLGNYSTWNISWTTDSLRIHRDGKVLFEHGLTTTPRRNRCVIGTGGGLRISHLFVLDRSINLSQSSW